MNKGQLLNSAILDGLLLSSTLMDDKKWTLVKNFNGHPVVLVNLFECDHDVLSCIDGYDDDTSPMVLFAEIQDAKDAVLEIDPDLIDKFYDESKVFSRVIYFDEDMKVDKKQLSFSKSLWKDEVLPGSEQDYTDFIVKYNEPETDMLFIDFVELNFNEDESELTFNIIVGSMTIEDEYRDIYLEVDIQEDEDMYTAVNAVLLGFGELRV